MMNDSEKNIVVYYGGCQRGRGKKRKRIAAGPYILSLSFHYIPSVLSDVMLGACCIFFSTKLIKQTGDVQLDSMN